MRTVRQWQPQQRRELWERWKRGEGVVEIAQALSRAPTSVFRVLEGSGGIAPAIRKRAARALRVAEREEISRGLATGMTIRGIARLLGRAGSTVSREIRRHGGAGGYRACEADRDAWDRGVRPKPCKLIQHRRLQRAVARKLVRNWSPQQISAWLERRYNADQTMRVSHETIYRTLFIQARGALKKELLAHLRSRRQMRSSKKPGQGGGQISEAISIRERPAEAQDRAVPGHWEGDLLCGGKSSQIATLVERHSRYVMLVSLARRTDRAAPRAPPSRDNRSFVCLRSCVARSRGIKVRRWPSTCASPSIRTSTSTSATRIAHGSVAATRTPTGCCGRTSRRTADLSALHTRRPRLSGPEATEQTRPPDKTLGWRKPGRSILSYCCVDRLRSIRPHLLAILRKTGGSDPHFQLHGLAAGCES